MLTPDRRDCKAMRCFECKRRQQTVFLDRFHTLIFVRDKGCFLLTVVLPTKFLALVLRGRLGLLAMGIRF